MKKNKNILTKLLSSMALMMTVVNVNTSCMFWIHQESVPKESNYLRKFR